MVSTAHLLRALAVLLATAAPLLAGIQAPEPVTVFLLRHAETGPKPERKLSPAGEHRAQALARLLKAAGVTHLFATDYPRTKGTLAPLAAATHLEIQLVSARKPKQQVEALRGLPPGSIAVVAGHSNTVPQLVALLGAKAKALTPKGWLAESEHDRLFAVTLGSGDRKASLIELRYGAAEATDGASKATSRPAVDPATIKVGAANNDRRSAATYFYTRGPSGLKVYGQCEVNYGSPAWRPEHAAVLAAAKPGTRHRLGENFFTTLDTSSALDIGGVRLAPGLYYLALERIGADTLALVCLDPAAVRAKKWNGSHSSLTTGGIRVPMRWQRDQDQTERLQIQWQPSADKLAVELRIQFGPHQLSAVAKPVLGT